MLAPAALPDGVRHVLVLDPLGQQMPVKPEVEPAQAKVKPGKRGSRK